MSASHKHPRDDGPSRVAAAGCAHQHYFAHSDRADRRPPRRRSAGAADARRSMKAHAYRPASGELRVGFGAGCCIRAAAGVAECFAAVRDLFRPCSHPGGWGDDRARGAIQSVWFSRTFGPNTRRSLRRGRALSSEAAWGPVVADLPTTSPSTAPTRRQSSSQPGSRSPSGRHDHHHAPAWALRVPSDRGLSATCTDAEAETDRTGS